MRLARIFLPTIFCLLSAASVAAQTSQQTCMLKLDEAPSLRGFRLGMTAEQVKSRLPSAAVNKGSFGHTALTVYHHQLKELGQDYTGVNYIELRFMDERVSSVAVEYDGNVRWRSPEEFAAKLSESLKLPSAWRREQPDGPFMTMKCDGFMLSTRPNFVRLNDLTSEKTFARRHEEAEEEKRRNFRP